MMEDRADDQTPGASSGCSEPGQVTVVYQQENAAPVEFLDDKIVMASPTELKLSEITEVADIPQESISSVGEETKILGEVVSLCDTTLEAAEPPTESKEGTADIDISIEIEDRVVTNPELPLLKGLKVELTDIVGELGESMHNSTVDMQNINEQFANLKSEILNEAEQQKPTRKRQTKVHVEKPVKYESLTHNAELARFAATLRAENKLMDVSLCCGELVVTAHRLVLVAYSKLLYSIIGADQTCSYVSLDNFAIPSSVLTGILDFMYTGVIHLPDSEKSTVLEAAKTLQVSSLIEILEPAVVKRKRGRPSKAEVHIASVAKSKVCEQSAAAAPRKLARAKQRRVIEISPVQPPAKKRGRPRKSEAAPVMVVDAAEEGKPEPATSLELPPEPESDGDDYVPDDSDNPDGEEEEPIAEDGDYSPKKKPGKRGRPRKSEAAKKTTTTKVKAKAISTKVKKVLTEEEKERLRILREKRANRPKPIKTDDGQFKCPIEGCLYISRTDSFIYNHIRSHSDERPFPCTLCEKRFKSKKHLDVHIRVHTGERPYACEVCGKRFKATKHRNRHRRVHTGEKVAFCEECGKGFSSNNQLSRHIMAVHRKERPHKCEHGDCGYAAADRSTLRQHMLQHLRDPNNPEACKDILCEVCGKGFLSANSLRLHRLSHMGEDLQCQDCDYITKYKSALESHVMRRHNKTMAGLPAEKRWRCDQCLYSCFTEAEFNMHMMKHRGEKPHKCPICDFATVDKGTLKKHVRHHTGEMPFVCKICTKAFSSQSGLARHNRIHTGIKPHKCDECDKAYADKKSLKAHKFTHLNIKPFECHMCVYSCVKKEYLFRHIQKTHGDESVPEHLRPNPEHKKYRPRNLFQGQQLDVSINQDGSDDTANVVVEEAHPDTEVLEYADRGATHAQVAAYANVTDIQGLVEGFQGGPPPLYPISHFAGNN